MEKRKFGRTNHLSSVAIFGGAAFWDIDQTIADTAFEIALQHGINHIDVAPSYGKAELLLGPWIKRLRPSFFLGCKTMERTRQGTLTEMKASLQRLQTDHFDLYQCHAVNSMAELDKVTMKGGALEALIEAKNSGFTRFLGITAHGMDAPTVLIEALSRFDFDSVLFPLNFILFTDDNYRQAALKLIEICQQKNVGMMTIKSIARGGWGSHEKKQTTWYEPFTDDTMIQSAVNFVLSHPVTGICTAGDTTLQPKVFAACENFHPLHEAEMQNMIDSSQQYVTEALF
ncbi:MAG: aldo/keto reductase [Chloroflexi bacterium]|nr:aldo/keto reductase [Chloroflexota bacterium]